MNNVDHELFMKVQTDFEYHLGLVLERDQLSANPKEDAVRLTQCVADEGFESGAGQQFLEESGIRAKWNLTFAAERSAVVAEWLYPELCSYGTVLDVLAGDCTLTNALAARLGDVNVVAVERLSDYSNINSSSGVQFKEFLGTRLPPSDLALVCAVLHHEVEPAALVKLLEQSSCTRFVVVENSIDNNFSADLHLAFDLFFNRTLNRFGSHCVREHRSVKQWATFLSGLGTLTSQSELRDVPGLPFPYQMMVFER